MATAAAMPMTDVAARTGCRPTLRRIMRTGADSKRASPARSSQLRRYRAGGSGRIASAGGSAATRRTAFSAPSAEATKLTVTPPATTPGGSRYCSVGNRKKVVVDRGHAGSQPGADDHAEQRRPPRR